MIEWHITEEDQGLALAFLQRKIPAAPIGYLRQLLRSGKVRCHGGLLAADDALRPGDRVILPESSRLQTLLAAPPPVQLDIRYETRELLIVNKPAGLAVHRGKGHEQDNLQTQLEQLMRTQKAPFAIAPVHRLDLETSGPVLFAKGKQAAAKLGRLFAEGGVVKSYLALVAGQMRGSGLLAAPVWAKGKMKTAATEFRAIADSGGLSLLQLDLSTGRTHQIRRQLAAIGHPLAGDRRYHGPLPATLSRSFLHCYRLALPDPFNESSIEIACPLPDELAVFLRQGYPLLWAALERESLA
ncbi:MAG: RluA family pseudouridine synthase [Desulfuromonadaceae bacterium]